MRSDVSMEGKYGNTEVNVVLMSECVHLLKRGIVRSAMDAELLLALGDAWSNHHKCNYL